VRGIAGDVAGLLLIAVRSFLLTLLFMLLLGVVLAASSYWILSGPHWVYGAVAALVALIECIAVGIVLAAKRATAVTLVHSLCKYKIGSAAVRLIFGRLLGVTADEAHGERGGWLTRTAERLPLSQAEKRLDEAIHSIVNAPSEGGGPTGWLRRRVQTRLLGAVHKYTLAHFRAEDARHGGVDLVQVQSDLGERIDGMLIGKLRGGINVWTFAVLIGLPVQIIALDYVVLALLK
jgi:hypothetical protein